LLAKLRAQAEHFGVRVEANRIERVERDGPIFVAYGFEKTWRSRRMLLATGVVDEQPGIEGLQDAIKQGIVRICAICDGFEAQDHRIAVYGPLEQAVRHATFLRTFSRTVTVISTTEPDAGTGGWHAVAAKSGIAIRAKPRQLAFDRDGCQFTFDGQGVERFDSVYPVLGAKGQTQIAVAMGAETDAGGELIVDGHMQTTVADLYAAGDVVSGLNQVSVAVGHAAVAATAIHNSLPNNHL
jgi:thioredoxin reductase (NADPH)